MFALTTVVFAILALTSNAQQERTPDFCHAISEPFDLDKDCPDGQVFIAPCIVATVGRKIEEDDAIQAVEDIVPPFPLSTLIGAAHDYIEFSREELADGTGCEMPTSEICGFLPCACKDGDRRKLQGITLSWFWRFCPIRLMRFFPLFVPLKVKKEGLKGSGEAVVLAICRDGKCTGFLTRNSEILTARSEVCGEMMTRSSLPICPSSITESCCNLKRKRSRVCRCRDCLPRFYQRTYASGIMTLKERGKNEECECRCPQFVIAQKVNNREAFNPL